MKERPILFSGEMVLAILEGRKTQTRRVAKLDPRMMEGEAADWCPYGKPRDRLWVKETHQIVNYMQTTRVIYRADGLYQDELWRPSIFMRRMDSRITLEITNVRVDRLQDISEEDAKAEGVPEDKYAVHYYCDEGDPNDPEDFGQHRCNWRFGFKMLWDSINGKGAWDKNPWAWVIEFKRISQNNQCVAPAAGVSLSYAL